MLLSCPKFCVTKENSLRWQVFQQRFKQLEVTPIFHNGRDYSTVCTEIVKNNLHQDCFMIFEDDACPVNDNYLDEMLEVEKQLEGKDWDVVYFGAHLLGADGEKADKNLIHKALPYCSHAVLYKSSSFYTLINLKLNNPTINVHSWDEMLGHSNLIKLIAFPMIITQFDSGCSLQSNSLVHEIMQRSYDNLVKRIDGEQKKSKSINLLEIIHPGEDIYENIEAKSDLQGWDSEAKVFENVLKQMKPELIVEVGTWKGASAIHLAKICEKLNYDTKILCVDTWLGSEEYYTFLSHWHSHLNKKSGFPSVYYTFLSNVVYEKMESKIIPFPTTSIIAAKVLKHHEIRPDLVYLDASHDFESVYIDLKLYYDILKPGGYLIGDDHSSTWQGVIDAVTKFKEEYQIFVKIEESKYVIKKPDVADYQ